jgi:hypothetical protein
VTKPPVSPVAPIMATFSEDIAGSVEGDENCKLGPEAAETFALSVTPIEGGHERNALDFICSICLGTHSAKLNIGPCR